MMHKHRTNFIENDILICIDRLAFDLAKRNIRIFLKDDALFCVLTASSILPFVFALQFTERD